MNLSKSISKMIKTILKYRKHTAKAVPIIPPTKGQVPK